MNKSVKMYYDCSPEDAVEAIEKVLIDCNIKYYKFEPEDGEDGPIEFKYNFINNEDK